MTDHRPAAAAPPLSPADSKLWSTLAHVGNVLGFLPSLLILLILGPRSPQVRDESKEALNVVITAAIAEIVLSVVSFVLSIVAGNAPSGVGLLVVLLVLLISLAQFAVYVALIVFSIVAAVRVNGGGSYRYPFSLRLVR